MKKIFLVLIILLKSSFLPADTDFNCHSKNSFSKNILSPIIQLELTPSAITDSLALSFLGEGGWRNYRLLGTTGYFLTPLHKLKFSAGYLLQKFGYHFSTERVHRWVHQFDFGGEYQYACNMRKLYSFDFYFSCSHAIGRTLNSQFCINRDSSKQQELFRHIAPGHNNHAAAGATFLPWDCGLIKITADFDHTIYKQKFRKDQTSYGLGSTVRLQQDLPLNFAFALSLQLRQPFYCYEMSLDWTTLQECGLLNVGLMGRYTQGRKGLPSSTVIGVFLSCSFVGGPVFSETCENLTRQTVDVFSDSDLLAWTKRPAIYMPCVLTKTEQRHHRR